MFSFFKKKNLKQALSFCQSHHKKEGIGRELAPELFNSVVNTPLFKDIDNRFHKSGCTNFGGLAWFSSQIIGTVSKQIKNGEEVIPSMQLLAEKMVSVSLLLANSISSLEVIKSLDLNKSDLVAIENTGEVALEWLELTRDPASEDFLSKVLPR